MESDEFRYACRTIESIEQIPEITDEDIKQIIDEEAKLRQLAINLQAKYAERVEAQNLTGQDYYAIAGIMGLCPGNCDWYETLFPRVVNLFVSSVAEGREILESIENNLTKLGLWLT